MVDDRELEFYTLDKILKYNADINIINGQRANGKTYAVLLFCLKDYWENLKKGNKRKFVYVRRMDLDLKPSNGIQDLFNGHIENDEIEKLTGGEWNSVSYRNKSFYLSRYDEETKKTIRSDDDFCTCLAVSQSHHYRGSNWANYYNFVFDEYIPETDEGYLLDEFKRFVNLVHTVKRHKTNFKIFLIGNTINKYNIYFNNFGLTNAKTQPQGTIDIYEAKDKDANGEEYIASRIAVEYCDFMEDEENANFYSQFKSEALDMILRGGYEAKYAPAKPCDFQENNIKFKYFIDFDGEVLQCEIVQIDGNIFTYIHRKTTPIKHPEKDLIFTQDWSEQRNKRRNILNAYDNIGRKIKWFYTADKVFYQDNFVGQMVKNYLKWCGQE